MIKILERGGEEDLLERGVRSFYKLHSFIHSFIAGGALSLLLTTVGHTWCIIQSLLCTFSWGGKGVYLPGVEGDCNDSMVDRLDG